MAEKKLNFNAPLLSTRTMKKEAVSVRRNMAKKLTDDDDDDLETNDSLSFPVLVHDMGQDRVPESASVPFNCSLGKAIDGNLQSSKDKEEEKDESEEEDVFSDALDTLSLKQSISGDVEATKPPMPFEDSQSRDFMLNRFLPAAKSMTVEQQQPHYALRRQQSPLMSKPVKQIRDIVPAENHATPKRYEYISTPSYYHGIDDEESLDDDDDDDVSDYLSKRGCGMSPQLCFKNTVGMLTSVHGVKEKPYSLKTSSHDQVKSSKVAQLKSRFQSVKKLALDSIYKQKMGSRAQSPVHPSFGKKFNFGSQQFESNLTTASMPSSPYRTTGSMSPYRSVGNSSPLHPAGFPGTQKEEEIMRANRLNKHIKNTSKSQNLLYPKSKRPESSTSSIIEKTLYVNTENLPETMKTISEEPEMAVNKRKTILKHQPVGIKKMEADELEKNSNGCDLSPLALPTPKKPSESWLIRNLPSVSSKITSRRYLFHPNKKDLKENSKWETIVKTQRDHICYSEELGAARSSCQSKT